MAAEKLHARSRAFRSDGPSESFRNCDPSGSVSNLRLEIPLSVVARFNFHVVALGEIESISGKSGQFAFEVSELGVYVRDSYDFNDAAGEDQDLGRWNTKDNTVGRTFLNGGTSVHNSDFRKWRDENNMGGDFLIYSDVKYTTLKTPERLTLDL